MEAMERWVRLSTGWVELGFKLTRTQPDWIGWTENGLANYWMFELNLMARVVSWVGWSHQVISGLKHSNKENIEKSKPRPKEHRNQNPDQRFHVPLSLSLSLSLKSLTLAPLLTTTIIKLVTLLLSWLIVIIALAILGWVSLKPLSLEASFDLPHVALILCIWWWVKVIFFFFFKFHIDLVMDVVMEWWWWCRCSVFSFFVLVL